MLREACERDRERLEDDLKQIKKSLNKEETDGKASLILVETLKERITSL